MLLGSKWTSFNTHAASVAIVSRRAKVRHMDAEFLRHSGMRDLQSAKHRHSSLQKPMGRFILLADAFLATAHERLSRHQACLSMSPFQRKTVLQI